MASYEPRFRESVARDLIPIPKPERSSGFSVGWKGSWTIRDHQGARSYSARSDTAFAQGHYRILYEILDEEVIVTVVKIGHRRHVYRH